MSRLLDHIPGRRLLRKLSSNLREKADDNGNPRPLSAPSTPSQAHLPTVSQTNDSRPGTSSAPVIVVGDSAQEVKPDATAWSGNVCLEPFFRAGLPNGDKRLIEKNSALEKATKRLRETIDKRTKAGRGQKAIFRDEDMTKVMQNAGSSSQSGAVFGRYVEAVVTEQLFLRNETTRGKLAKYAARLYPTATIVLGLVSFGADAASFSPVKIVANGLQQVLTAAMDQHNQMEDLAQQLEILTDYGPFLDNLRDLVNSSQLLEKATDLLIAMTNFLRESLLHLDRSVAARLINESWAGSKALLETACKRLDGQVLKDMQLAFFNWIEQDSNNRIISSISKDASFREKQQQYWTQLMPGTGQWVLEDEKFKAWEKGGLAGKARVLCSGAGKTFIASRIVTHLEDTRQEAIFQNPTAKIGIAYIYCSVANERQQTVEGFISSVARQLVESPVTRPNPLMREAEKFHKQHVARAPKLSDYKGFIQDLITHLDYAFVVVDALDECDEYGNNRISVRDTFVRTLLSLNVRLLFTSRNVGAVDRLVRESEKLGIFLQKMEIMPLPDDIRRYIRWRIYDEERGNHHLREWIEDGNLSESEIINEVFNKYSDV
ncbi:hypothetical protein FQN49_002588 [Arthroderma sp. PD_2]|nr:hypothetical protein FQN49_002588 [Arthroderma sp. PD_2]